MVSWDSHNMPELQYLRFCLGIDKECPIIDDCEWPQVYDFCVKQSVLGIGFVGCEMVSANNRPSKELMLNWYAQARQIEGRNQLMNDRGIELQTMFAEAGFEMCILKGQGNALMYSSKLRIENGKLKNSPQSDNLALLRQPGDIDIWVRTRGDGRGTKGDIRRIIEFLGTKCDIQKQVIGYHHVEFPIFNDVEVEVHWRPSWKSSPLYNQRMQKWFKEQADAQFNHVDERSGMHVPTWEFNVIYLLQHMYLHIFQEGLGLRQVMDYYYLLHSAEDKLIIENGKLRSTLKYLGLWKFAGAAMYVMQEVFALDEKFMIAPVDKRRGTFLLEEIMRSGNFGRYDERNRELSQKKGISRSLSRLKRQYRYLRDYPVEVLCAPFQIYHVIWRKCQIWRWE